MKIKDLIYRLEQFDPELEVIQAIDEEGNSFRKTGAVGAYWAELEEYYIDWVRHESDFELNEDIDVNCLVLWP